MKLSKCFDSLATIIDAEERAIIEDLVNQYLDQGINKKFSEIYAVQERLDELQIDKETIEEQLRKADPEKFPEVESPWGPHLEEGGALSSDAGLVPGDIEITLDDSAKMSEHREQMLIQERKNKVLAHLNAEKETLSLDEARERYDAWMEEARRQGRDPEIRARNAKKTILSLFDVTGNWVRPWIVAGYDVRAIDKMVDDVDVMDMDRDWFEEFGMEDVYAVFAACPCTEFSNAGNKYKPGGSMEKENAQEKQDRAIELVHHTMGIIEHLQPMFWVIENPVGQIEGQAGLPPAQYSFEPHHFGAPWTKKTQLWGNFNQDLPTANVEPTGGSWAHKLRGDIQEEKNARSDTFPEFAAAFFMANNDERFHTEAERQRDMFIDLVLSNEKFDNSNKEAIGDAYMAGILSHLSEYEDNIKISSDTESYFEDGLTDAVYVDAFNLGRNDGEHWVNEAYPPHVPYNVDKIAENLRKVSDRPVAERPDRKKRKTHDQEGITALRKQIESDGIAFFRKGNIHYAIQPPNFEGGPFQVSKFEKNGYSYDTYPRFGSFNNLNDILNNLNIKSPSDVLSPQAAKESISEVIPNGISGYFESALDRAVDTIQAAADTAAASPNNDLPEPTEAQIEADNYKKGHFTLDGMDIAIENPAGSTRNPEWPDLVDHYGHILGTIAHDDDPVDAFFNNETTFEEVQERPIFVVDQVLDGEFDEHKVIFGAQSEEEALQIYNRNYEEGWDAGKAVTKFTPAKFKQWAFYGGPTKGAADKDLRLGIEEPADQEYEDYLAEQEERYVANITKKAEELGIDEGELHGEIIKQVKKLAKGSDIKLKDYPGLTTSIYNKVVTFYEDRDPLSDPENRSEFVRGQWDALNDMVNGSVNMELLHEPYGQGYYLMRSSSPSEMDALRVKPKKQPKEKIEETPVDEQVEISSDKYLFTSGKHEERRLSGVSNETAPDTSPAPPPTEIEDPDATVYREITMDDGQTAVVTMTAREAVDEITQELDQAEKLLTCLRA